MTRNNETYCQVYSRGRVSVATGGNQATGGTSTQPAISSDGRYVAFHSAATNLVADDTNGQTDVFVHDRKTGETSRVSVATGGVQATGGASNGVIQITPDGRYVAFTSNATNLVSGDTNATTDAFLHDRYTGITTRESLTTGGVQIPSGGVSAGLNFDARYFSFSANDATIVSGDTNGAQDVYIRDRTTGTVARVSLATDGTEGNATSNNPTHGLSGLIGFSSSATNLVSGDTNAVDDTFVHDLSDGTTLRVSLVTGGTQATGGGSGSFTSIGGNGRFVAFQSSATNLVSDDTNALLDVFLHDRSTTTTVRASVATGGTQATGGGSSQPSISADGRHVVFLSSATNLVSGDTNGLPDVFAHDRDRNTTTRISTAADGTESNGTILNLQVSSSCPYIAFDSAATNIESGDTNAQTDVFVVDVPR